MAGYGQLPLSFEPNVGQVDRRVTFIARGAGYRLYLTATGGTLALQPLSTGQGSLADGGLGRKEATGHGMAATGAARAERGTTVGCGMLGGKGTPALAGGCLPGERGGLGRGATTPVREGVVSLRYVEANAHPRMAGATSGDRQLLHRQGS